MEAKHYAISDIHGMYNIYEQVCDMLNPNDVVYFLGDAADRGYANFETMKAIYNNPQWIYLKGNHEDMMAKALRQQVGDYIDIYNNPMSLWFWNGGQETFNDWILDGGDDIWINRLNKLPLEEKYTNEKGITFHMTHAGFTCGYPEEKLEDDLLWSRIHFYTKWKEEDYPNDICIHGHTPMEHFLSRIALEDTDEDYEPAKPQAKVYSNGHKINIDNGVFYTNATVLYDLDEMKAIPIFDKTSEVE